MRALKQGYGKGWVAEFADEEALLAATAAMLEAGLKHWDVFAPYPCEAARISSMRHNFNGRKLLTCLGVAGGVLGGFAVLLWLYLTQHVLPDPLVNQGRLPGMDLWFGYVPPVFEGILLGAGLFLSFGFLWVARLPSWSNWVFACPELSARATGESFFIVAGGSETVEAGQVLRDRNPVFLEWVEYDPGCHE